MAVRTQLVVLCSCVLFVFLTRTSVQGTYDFALQKLAGARLLGFIKSGVAAVGVLGAVPVGRAADWLGPSRRWTLFLIFIALEAVSVTAMTQSEGFLPGMVAGQVLLTLAYSSEDMAKAFVADHTPAHSPERTAWMGRYFSCVGLGYFLGPRLARRLKGDYGFTLKGLGGIAAATAAATSLVGMALPGSIMGQSGAAKAAAEAAKPAAPEKQGGPAPSASGEGAISWRVLLSPSLLTLIGVRVLMMMQFHTVTSNMGLTIKRGLGGTAEDMDFVLSYFGGIFALFQLTWVPAMTAACPKPTVALPIALALTVVGRASTAAFGSTPTTFLAHYTIYMLGQSWHVPVLISLISSHAPRGAVSLVMGVTKFAEGVATVSGPMVGGNLVHYYGPFATLWFGAGVCGAALLLVGAHASSQPGRGNSAGESTKQD